jgi:hypothetical protein
LCTRLSAYCCLLTLLLRRLLCWMFFRIRRQPDEMGVHVLWSRRATLTTKLIHQILPDPVVFEHGGRITYPRRPNVIALPCAGCFCILVLLLR